MSILSGGDGGKRNSRNQVLNFGTKSFLSLHMNSSLVFVIHNFSKHSLSQLQAISLPSSVLTVNKSFFIFNFVIKLKYLYTPAMALLGVYKLEVVVVVSFQTDEGSAMTQEFSYGVDVGLSLVLALVLGWVSGVMLCVLFIKYVQCMAGKVLVFGPRQASPPVR